MILSISIVFVLNFIFLLISGKSINDWCLSDQNDLEYSWGEIDAFLRLPNGTIYCFQRDYLYKIDSIKENGLVVLNNDHLLNGRRRWKEYFIFKTGRLAADVMKSSLYYNNTIENIANDEYVYIFNLKNNQFEFLEVRHEFAFPFVVSLRSNKTHFKDYQEVILINCQYLKKPKFCPIVFYRSSFLKQYYRYYYTLDDDTDKYIGPDVALPEYGVSAGFATQAKIQTKSTEIRVISNTICLSIDHFSGNNKPKVFAFFQFDIKESMHRFGQTNSYVRQIFRKSPFRPNQMWFGCPTSLCFYAAIDAIANAFNDTVYIFSGNYFWKWNNYLDYPKVKDAILLKPEFRHIDSAYMDTESAVLYVLKGDYIFRFNDNNYNNKDVKKIANTFEGLQSGIDATRFDYRKKLIYLFKGENYWIYTNEYKRVKSGRVEELGLPNGLSAAFTDDNGDDIYIKNNYAFRKEYGLYKQFLVQKVFRCNEDYYKTIQIPSINTWNKFEAEHNSFASQLGLTPKPTSRPSEATSISGKNSEDISHYPTDTDETIRTTKPSTPNEGLGIALWLIIVMVVGSILLAIVCAITYYFFGFYFSKSSEMLTKKQQFKEKLAKRKEMSHKIHLMK